MDKLLPTRATVQFSFTAENDDELTLTVGDIVEVLGEVEEGWWRGILNEKIGVFPSNFVKGKDELPPHSNVSIGVAMDILVASTGSGVTRVYNWDFVGNKWVNFSATRRTSNIKIISQGKDYYIIIEPDGTNQTHEYYLPSDIQVTYVNGMIQFAVLDPNDITGGKLIAIKFDSKDQEQTFTRQASSKIRAFQLPIQQDYPEGKGMAIDILVASAHSGQTKVYNRDSFCDEWVNFSTICRTSNIKIVSRGKDFYVIIEPDGTNQTHEYYLPSDVQVTYHVNGMIQFAVLDITGGKLIAIKFDNKDQEQTFTRRASSKIRGFRLPITVVQQDYPEEKAQHVGEKLAKSSSIIEIDQECLDNAMKEGYVKSCVAKAVVQGEARAGKTSLKCLLLSQSYDKLSTGCIEAPSVAISQYVHTGKHSWSLVKDEELNEKVLSELHAIAENSLTSTTLSKAELISEEPGVDDSDLNPGLRKQVQPVTAPVPSASANSKGLTDDELFLQPIASRQASEKVRKEAIAKVKELYEQCKRVRENEGLSFHEEWLYFIDSGGQLQFQKLLPAFMPFASVLTLVLNVANNLSDPASTEMQLQDQLIRVSEHSPTVEEILKQLLSAIASSTEKFNSLIVRDPILSKYIALPAEQLNVIAVATHCDEYNELVKKGEVETLQVKEAKLNEIFDSVKSKCTILRGSPPQLNILHEVDGSKAKRDEFDDPVVEQIAEKLQTQAYEIEVPIKWYCFHVLLRRIAKEGCGVLSLAYCEALGQELGMSGEEVGSALKFFHVLNMLLYYPDSPVTDMAFIHLNSLIDIIGELVVLVCTARQNWGAAEDDIQELATKGLLSVGVLEKCSKYLKISKVFHEFGSNLLGLFEHLLIAVRLPAERDKFFMPALLPVKDVSKANSFPNRTPLLFSFDNAVPVGLFCAFIVQLLSVKPDLSNEGDAHTSDYETSSSSSEDDEISKTSSNPWQIIRKEDLNWSNCFTLQNSDTKTTFDLVEMLDCIEVHAEYPDPQVANSMEKAIKTTIEMWWLNEKIKKAFYCNCPVGGGIKHKAIVSRDKVTHKRVLQCKKSGAFGDLNDEQTCWLKVKANKEKSTFSPALLQKYLKEEPKYRDLLNHLNPTKHKWKEIGGQLGLEECDLQAAGQETSDELRLGSVMQFWKKKDSPKFPYTWCTILDIISGYIGDKDLRNRIEQELGTEKVDTTKQTNVPATSDSGINVSSGASEGAASASLSDNVMKETYPEPDIKVPTAANERQKPCTTATEVDNKGSTASTTVQPATEEIERSQSGAEKDDKAALLSSLTPEQQNKDILRDYTKDQILALLDKNDLEDYKEIFRERKINGRKFLLLTDEILEGYNVTDKLDRSLIMSFVNGEQSLSWYLL